MTSKFAEKLAQDLRLKDAFKDALSEQLARTSIDISLLGLNEALTHARYRNHDHNPEACNACKQIDTVAETLKIQY
jgi:hypothetical protein